MCLPSLLFGGICYIPTIICISSRNCVVILPQLHRRLQPAPSRQMKSWKLLLSLLLIFPVILVVLCKILPVFGVVLWIDIHHYF